MFSEDGLVLMLYHPLKFSLLTFPNSPWLSFSLKTLFCAACSPPFAFIKIFPKVTLTFLLSYMSAWLMLYCYGVIKKKKKAMCQSNLDSTVGKANAWKHDIISWLQKGWVKDFDVRTLILQVWADILPQCIYISRDPVRFVMHCGLHAWCVPFKKSSR